jgi:hypothetical protein
MNYGSVSTIFCTSRPLIRHGAVAKCVALFNSVLMVLVRGQLNDNLQSGTVRVVYSPV